MEKRKVDVIEEYRAKVSRISLLLIIISASLAGIYFPVMYFIGLYPGVSVVVLSVFFIVIVVRTALEYIYLGLVSRMEY